MEHIADVLGGAVPSTLWSIVRWIAFIFKLASLASVIPIIGLIVFDFCIWLWRLYRPSKPADSPRLSRPPKDYIQQPSPTPTRASSSTAENQVKSQTADRRITYENTAVD
ncbi:hypothetical protein F4777DRAFT_576517 [Nemania sp. FL0916]|nr:hypothetical protein F4777DRAFT_576517 [Nemania sp. FL0916]